MRFLLCFEFLGKVFSHDWLAIPFVMMTCRVRISDMSLYSEIFNICLLFCGKYFDKKSVVQLLLIYVFLKGIK